MIDLASLRPTDNSPPAIAAALDRSLAAGQVALARLEPLKAQHAALHLSGEASPQLEEIDAKLARATEDAVQVGQLINELRQELDKATAAMAAERSAAVAYLALAEMAKWVNANSEILAQGVQLLGGVFNALTPPVATPPVPSSPAAPTNVVRMRPGVA